MVMTPAVMRWGVSLMSRLKDLLEPWVACFPQPSAPAFGHLRSRSVFRRSSLLTEGRRDHRRRGARQALAARSSRSVRLRPTGPDVASAADCGGRHSRLQKRLRATRDHRHCFALRLGSKKLSCACRLVPNLEWSVPRRRRSKRASSEVWGARGDHGVSAFRLRGGEQRLFSWGPVRQLPIGRQWPFGCSAK